jgi:hypothetical protein
VENKTENIGAQYVLCLCASVLVRAGHLKCFLIPYCDPQNPYCDPVKIINVTLSSPNIREVSQTFWTSLSGLVGQVKKVSF